MACVLRGRLPADVVQHIQTLAAATRIQAIARAMLVRVHRMPMCRHGFEPLAALSFVKVCTNMVARTLSATWSDGLHPSDLVHI